MELLVLRHSPSVWTAQKRIHGQSDLSSLSADGVSTAQQWGPRLASYGDIRLVWSSDLSRARESAEFIASYFGVPLRTSPLLREVNTGVLDGMTQEEASTHFPHAYQLWLQGADLDAIPGAETGDALQARALAYLARFAWNMQPETHIVVSHAALIKSLINTVTGQPRHTPVAVGYEDLHCVDQPWQRLPVHFLYVSWRLPIMRVETKDGAYVAKWIEGPLDERKLGFLRLGQLVAKEIAVPDPLLAYTEVDPEDTLNGRPSIVVIRRWVSGYHKLGMLSAREEEGLIQLLRKHYQALYKVSTPENMQVVTSFSEKLAKRIQYLNPDEQALLNQLYRDSRVRKLLERREVIVDIDVHRENILFSDEGVAKIDWHSLCSGPSALPLACALVGGFMLYQNDNLLRYLTALSPRDWTPAELDELLVLMKFRVLYGLGFFRAKQRTAADAVEHYIVSYQACLKRIEEGRVF
jgi:broad specificity phosphatase PhoE